MKPAKFTTSIPDDAIPATARGQGESLQLPDAQLQKVRADFRTEEFRKLIQQKGYFFVWRKALLCTCVNTETMQPRPDCRVCNSTALFYIDPIQIQGVMSGLEKRKDIYRNLGEWVDGTAMVTVAPEHRFGFKDSLEMQHSVMTFNEWLKKGNRDGFRAGMPANFDVARYSIVRMLHLMYPDANGAPVAVTESVHFSITSQGWIEWIGPGRQIPDGTIFSANYEFHPVWIVITHPHAVRDTVSKFKKPTATVEGLPTQAMVKLDYLFSDHATNSEIGRAHV